MTIKEEAYKSFNLITQEKFVWKENYVGPKYFIFYDLHLQYFPLKTTVSYLNTAVDKPEFLA